MTDLELIRMLVGDDSLPVELVSFYLSLSEDFIKNYCNIPEVPPQLHNVMIQIAAVKLKANSDEGQSSLGAGVSSITSVSEAGQSVSWGRVTSSKNFIGDDDLIETFGPTLDNFRRIDSGRPPRRRCCCGGVKVRRFY